MAEPPDPNKTFAQLWPTLRPLLEDVDPSATIQPELDPQATNVRVDGPHPGPAAGLGPLGDMLGKGGMGEVRSAQQRSMGRPVAVKVTHTSATHPIAVRRALQEAWITGLLEHSNIVPVYDIVEDADGRPHILMREIKGRGWVRIIHDKPGKSLAWHIGILVEVCHAVSYAHEHGVLHRDIKPENVMIGDHGEVHLLDWGLALALDDRHPAWIPRAADEHRLAGTPRYIAPEMTLANGHLLSAATDVYLLGGTLHEVLTGRPPHAGHRDLESLLHGVESFEPSFPESAPAALQALCRRCLRSAPGDRPESAEAVRVALSHWLQTRQAVALAQEARQHLDTLSAALLDGGRERSALYEAFAAARFGFQQALREWPDHPTARDGLRATVLAMAEHELERGQPGVAEPILAELANPPPALVARLQAALLEQTAQRQHLANLAHDASPLIGVRTRVFVGSVASAVWLSLPAYLVVTATTPSWRTLVASTVVMIVGFGAILFWARDSLSKTALNRATGATLFVVPLAHSLTDLLAWSQGHDSGTAYAYRLGAWAIVAIMYAATVSRHMVWAALAYVIAAGIGSTFEGWAPLAALLANVALLVNLSVIWGPAWIRARGYRPRRTDPSQHE